MTAPSVAKARDLERVRINQQRSRDRKRQYVAELEHKVKQLEHDLRQTREAERSFAGADSTTKRLAHENRVRGDLLCVLGIDKATQERFIRAAPQSDPVSSQLAIDAAESDTAPARTTRRFDAQSTPTVLSPHDEKVVEEPIDADGAIAQISNSRPLVRNGNRGARSPSISEFFRSIRENSEPLKSFEGQMLSPEPSLCTPCSSSSIPATIDHEASDSTTACSIAFSMVLSNNKRGYNFVDLESRMRAGYQKGELDGEECRVLNKVLFEVLAEIT